MNSEVAGMRVESAQRKVQGLRPDREVMTRQRLPYFIGVSGRTVGASGLSMHIVAIRVLTRWGHALEHEAGDFLVVPPGVPHEAINLSATEPARAAVARNDPAEQDKVEPFTP